MAFYRKYRPQSLEELIGQDQVKLTLKKAFESQKLAHAYLFAGPRGLGKTSTARILAKMVNCKDPSLAPCNNCDSCLSITDGSSLDLIEIDAASNRGIDDIRELRERIKLAPVSSNKKVYIIDEVHMLTTEAFNALLKTLEEPPSHALFILATTEEHKIPQTITSRVQKLNFKIASIDDLVTALKNVSQKEAIKIDDQALKLIAKKADGSFRDSLKLLDQLASQYPEITQSMVEESLKSGKLEDIVSLLEAISQNDPKLALENLDSALKKGLNLKEFLLTTLDLLRSIMLIKNGAENLVKEDLGSQNYPPVLSLSEKFTTEKNIKVLNLMLEAWEKMKYASIASLPLEIAIVESSLKPQIIASIEKEISVTVVNSAPNPIVHEDKKPDPVAPSEELNVLKDKWQFILETIKHYNYSLEALLKQAKLLSCDDGTVTLEVPYSFHQRILQAPKSRNLLESVLADVLGKPIKVNTSLGSRPVRVEELANVELAADDEIVRLASEIFNS